MKRVSILTAALVIGLTPRWLTAAAAPRRLEPERVEVAMGGRRQLRARRAGAPGAAVLWRVVQGVGSVDRDGVYAAPTQGATPATAVVRGESGGIAVGEARVMIPAVRVRAEAERGELQLGEAGRLRARVEGAEDARVRWSIDGGAAHGEVSDAGLYTAPDRHETPATVVVRATSVADPSKSALVPLRLRAVTVAVRPRETRLRLGETRRFEAEVRGARQTGVHWAVVGEGRGTITSTGLYSPPESIGTPTVVTITATSEADPSEVARARVMIAEVGLKITPLGAPRARRGDGPRLSATVYRVVRLSLPLDPLDALVRFPLFRGRSGKTYVPLGGAYQFRAVGDGADAAIRWSLEGEDAPGSVSEDGLYRAPERLATPQVVRVVAQSLADPGRRAVATLHIPPVVLEAARREVSVPVGGAVQLEAAARNAENDRVRWEVEGGAARGSVSASGLFQPAAPLTTPTTVRVRALSDADETKTLPFGVSVPAVSVRLEPQAATVQAGGALRLRARVRNAADTTVLWHLDPPLGTITAGGSYSAPTDVEHETPVEISASSAADPTKTARAVVRVLPRR